MTKKVYLLREYYYDHSEVICVFGKRPSVEDLHAVLSKQISSGVDIRHIQVKDFRLDVYKDYTYSYDITAYEVYNG